MQRGATDFMTKPLHLDKLELIIKRLLKSRTVEQENEALKAQLHAKMAWKISLETLRRCRRFLKRSDR